MFIELADVLAVACVLALTLRRVIALADDVIAEQTPDPAYLVLASVGTGAGVADGCAAATSCILNRGGGVDVLALALHVGRTDTRALSRLMDAITSTVDVNSMIDVPCSELGNETALMAPELSEREVI